MVITEMRKVLSYELYHAKTGLTIFVTVIPKEGLAGLVKRRLSWHQPS